MDFPPGYLIALTSTRIERHFPNLNKGNFYFKSLKTDDYNCVAWSVERDDDWIEFPLDPDGNYDDSVSKYVDYFKSLGFEVIENSSVEEGIKKIAIYVDDENNFRHAARLLPDGKWASKIGDWEDIEHLKLEDLADKSYGKPSIIMGKKLP